MHYSWKLLFLSFLLFCFFQQGFSQGKVAVNGIIKDAKTGETLIGAIVKLNGVNQLTTVSNAYGFYSLSLAAGEYRMTINYIGYLTVERVLTINVDTRMDFTLVQNNQLEEVVISSVRKDENVSNPQMGVEKVNISDVRNVPVLFGERDILKTAQLLPGIKSAGEGNSGFYVRGGSADQNLILLDEAPVYNASHLLGFFSTFNSDAIKDVTVYKGGMPAQYGGRLSSVLDIKMNDGNRKDYTVEGGIGLIASRAKVEGPIVKDKGSFMISGRRTYADLFLKLSSDEAVSDNTLFFYDLNAKTNYQFSDKDIIYLSGYFGRDKLVLGKNFGFNWGNATGTLRWNHLYSSRLFSNTSLIYSNYDYVIENFNAERNFKVSSSIKDLNLKQDFQYALNNKHGLKFGFNAIHHTLSPGRATSEGASSVNETAIENRKGAELAAYISDEWAASKNINIVYGLRASNFLAFGPGNFKTYDADGFVADSTRYRSGEIVKTYFNLEPRISASFKLNQQSAIKTSYTRNAQNVHLMSNSTTTSPTDLYIMNSNNVRPEIADQIAGGYFRNFNNDKFEFSIEVYYKWMQNQIEFKNGTDLRGNRAVESDLLFGKGRAYGTELFFKKRFGKFNGWIGYTLSRTERQFDRINDGKWFNARQDITHDISLVGIYRASERWTFSSVFIYNTGNAVTYPSAKYQLNGQTVFYYGEKNGYRTPAYHRLDISATLEAKPENKLQSSWSFGFYNLYNRQNAFAIDFENDPKDNTRTRAVKTTLFGIIPSVTWNFKF